MGAEVTILANPYTYNFLKGLTHSALMQFLAFFGIAGWRKGFQNQNFQASFYHILKA